MANVTTKVCDVCGKTPATSVTIQEGNRVAFEVDLCLNHSGAIAQFRDCGRAPRGSRAYRTYRKSAFVDRGQAV